MGGSSWMCLRSTTAPATPADSAGSDLVDVPRSHLPLLPLGGDAPQGRPGLPLPPPLVDPPITEWRFAAVVAILLPLPFQTVDTSHQLRNVLEGLSHLLSQFLLLGLPRCFFRQPRCYLLFQFGYPLLCFHSPQFITSFNPSWAVTATQCCYQRRAPQPSVRLRFRPAGRTTVALVGRDARR